MIWRISVFVYTYMYTAYFTCGGGDKLNTFSVVIHCVFVCGLPLQMYLSAILCPSCTFFS